MNSTIPTTYVAWHCRKCGYQHEAERLIGGYPVKCPKCAESEVSHGYPCLPVNNVSRDEHPQRYDLCSNKKSIQVYLRAATGEATGVCIGDENDVPDCTDEPIAVAEAVLELLKTYIYTSQKPKVEAVLAAMRACEAQSDHNWRENRKHELRRDIVLGIREFESLNAAEEDAK